MAYAKVRTDNMVGTILGNALVSFKYQPSSTDTAIENGNVVLIGNLLTGEREIHAADTPSANSNIDKIALVASEEVIKDKPYNTIAEFRNEAGDVCRGYYLHKGDEFSVSAEALTQSSATVGYIAELQAGTKIKLVSSLTSGSTKIGEVFEISDGWYAIRVC